MLFSGETSPTREKVTFSAWKSTYRMSFAAPTKSSFRRPTTLLPGSRNAGTPVECRGLPAFRDCGIHRTPGARDGSSRAIRLASRAEGTSELLRRGKGAALATRNSRSELTPGEWTLTESAS